MTAKSSYNLNMSQRKNGQCNDDDCGVTCSTPLITIIMQLEKLCSVLVVAAVAAAEKRGADPTGQAIFRAIF